MSDLHSKARWSHRSQFTYHSSLIIPNTMSGIRECKDNLLIKAKARPEGYSEVVGRGEMGLRHLEFGLLRLISGEWSGKTGKCEQALDIYSGAISLETSRESFPRLGDRDTPFAGSPTVVYLPPKTQYTVKVLEGPVEIGVFSATAPKFEGDVKVVGPDDAVTMTVGRDNWRRESHTALGTNADVAKLILAEVMVPPGNWASAPVHKHDAFNPPAEVPLEEICYFHVDPRQGFGVMRIYTGPNDPGPMDEIYVVENGDTVVVPRGYHLIGAAPGYAISYTSVLAGDVRIPGAFSFEPRHAWIAEGNG